MTLESKPYSSALLSRCKVIVLEKLSADSVFAILKRAAEARGFSVGDILGDSFGDIDGVDSIGCLVEVDALNYLSGISDGDARMALNCLQVHPLDRF